MRLSEVVIQNFCSCQAVTVQLSNFNPIVGYNNSGKSNILRAINWLLKKSVLPSHMFYKADEAVIVEGVIENVDLTLLPVNQSEAVAPYVHVPLSISWPQWTSYALFHDRTDFALSRICAGHPKNQMTPLDIRLSGFFVVCARHFP